MSIKLSVYWFKLPLKYPYHLSFGVVHEFDSIIESMEKEQKEHSRKVKAFFSKSNTQKRLKNSIQEITRISMEVV